MAPPANDSTLTATATPPRPLGIRDVLRLPDYRRPPSRMRGSWLLSLPEPMVARPISGR